MPATRSTLRSARPLGGLRAAWPRLGVAGLALCLAGAGHLGAEPAEEAPLRLGFSQQVFEGRSENDLLAALKVWADTLFEQGGVRIDPAMAVFRSVDELAELLRSHRLDGVSLTLEDAVAMPEGLLAGPYLRDERGGDTHRRFVLLVRADGDIDQLADLRSQKVALFTGREASLTTTWLDAQLSQEGLPRSSELFGEMEAHRKISTAVLNVFFGQSSAGIVTEAGFRTMVDLNPQLGRSLRVLLTSPPFMPTLFCFSTDLAPTRREGLAEEFLGLTTWARGRQVLEVFQADRVVVVSPVEVERSLDLVRSWHAAADPDWLE